VVGLANRPVNRAEEVPGAGGLFHLNLGIHGLPEFLSRIGP